jgi:hypothetical protein
MKVRIETDSNGFCQKITDGQGNSIGKYCFDATLRMKVGAVATLELHNYLTGVSFEGDVEVERIVVCPSCRKELDRQLSSGIHEIATPAATTLGDEYETAVAGPLLKNDD